jgi:hypothetical protein
MGTEVVMALGYKKLDEASLAKLQALENETGYCVVALERQPELADISETELREIQSLEKEMDAVLLAYSG